MAVVSVTLKNSGLNASVEKGGLSDAARVTAAKVYCVVFDTIAVGNALAAQYAAGVPAVSDAWDGVYTWLRLRRKQAHPTARNPYVYDVTCEYSGESSPLAVPAVKGWDSKINEEPVEYDANGDAVVNPLGDPIVGFTMPFYDKVYTYTRNEATSANCAPNAYEGSTNADAVVLDGFTCPIGTAVMDSIRGNRVVDGSYYYWTPTYQILYRADGWQKRELCQGNYYWTGKTLADGNKQRMPCVAGDGVTPRTRPLDANGRLLDDGDPHVWLLFDRHPSVVWAGLGLT